MIRLERPAALFCNRAVCLLNSIRPDACQRLPWQGDVQYAAVITWTSLEDSGQRVYMISDRTCSPNVIARDLSSGEGSVRSHLDNSMVGGTVYKIKE